MDEQVIYSGKTKDIQKLPNGNLLIRFKDDVTGENGVVDPGANTVMGKIKGKGRMSLELTSRFFSLLQARDIPTHLVSVDLERGVMEVREAVPPGQNVSSHGGLEFICRPLAYGSFLRRYQNYVAKKLQDLDYLVEITLKDDERGDPLINDDAIVALGILSGAQLKTAKQLTRSITEIVEQELAKCNLRLVDIKIEFGLIDGQIVLIDEISADSMRVMDEKGQILPHEEVYRCLVKT